MVIKFNLISLYSFIVFEMVITLIVVWIILEKFWHVVCIKNGVENESKFMSEDFFPTVPQKLIKKFF